jgi:hypothetical protein
MKIAKKSLVGMGLLAGAFLTVGVVARDPSSVLGAQKDIWAVAPGGNSRGTSDFAGDYRSEWAQVLSPRPGGPGNVIGPPGGSLRNLDSGPLDMDFPPPPQGLLPGWPGPMMGHGPHFALPPARTICEERINRISALAGYIKSKLRLQGVQKDNWSKIELAAEPTIEKMREACGSLPNDASAPPTMPTMILFGGKEASARAEFLSVISKPAQAFYDSLSTEQREMLNRALLPRS